MESVAVEYTLFIEKFVNPWSAMLCNDNTKRQASENIIQGVFQKFQDFFRKKATNNYFCKIYLLASK